MTNGRQNWKFIKSLVFEDNVVLDNFESISKEIKRHFGKLFSKPLSGSWRIIGLDWSPISIENVDWLVTFFRRGDSQCYVAFKQVKGPLPRWLHHCVI